MVSKEKSAVNLIGHSLYTMSCFSLAVFKILFVFEFWQFEYDVSWCESACWRWLKFLNVYIHVFPQIWEILDHSFFKCFSFPFISLSSPPGTLAVSILVCSMESYRSLCLCSLVVVLFFCSSDWIILKFLSPSLPILSSAQSDLLLSPASEVFISAIGLFISRICWIPFYNFSLMILFLVHTLFSWFPSVFGPWFSLAIEAILTILNWCFQYLWFLRDCFCQIIFFPLWMGQTLPFLCTFCNFWWELDIWSIMLLKLWWSNTPVPQRLTNLACWGL